MREQSHHVCLVDGFYCREDIGHLYYYLSEQGKGGKTYHGNKVVIGASLDRIRRPILVHLVRLKVPPDLFVAPAKNEREFGLDAQHIELVQCLGWVVLKAKTNMYN